MLRAYQGYFDKGKFFSLDSPGKKAIPKAIPEKRMVIINVLDDVPIDQETKAEKQLKAFEKFITAIRDDDEELPPEFDEIMAQRFNIDRELDL